MAIANFHKQMLMIGLGAGFFVIAVVALGGVVGTVLLFLEFLDS